MKVTQLIPEARDIEISDLLEDLSNPELRHPPFSEPLLQFTNSFSESLFRDPQAKQFPELGALAYWARRAALKNYQNEFSTLGGERSLLVPRGFVFHIPPSNVDAMFVYSWLVSLWMGNSNLIRMPSRASPLIETLLGIISRLLAEPQYSAIRAGNSMVQYERNPAITSEISARADVLVIWGGDETVSVIRQAPLGPQAKDITFANRYSFALFDAAAVCELTSDGISELAERLYRDSFWFDQQACSSPRTIIWRGGVSDIDAAGNRLFAALEAEISRRGFRAEVGIALEKFSAICELAARDSLCSARMFTNELAISRVPLKGTLQRQEVGGGWFQEYCVESLDELLGLITVKDQTASYFGFSGDEIRALAERLNGRGIDRFVPVGEALAFERFWDGYDLFQELTRRVRIS